MMTLIREGGWPMWFVLFFERALAGGGPGWLAAFADRRRLGVVIALSASTLFSILHRHRRRSVSGRSSPGGALGAVQHPGCRYPERHPVPGLRRVDEPGRGRLHAASADVDGGGRRNAPRCPAGRSHNGLTRSHGRHSETSVSRAGPGSADHTPTAITSPPSVTGQQTRDSSPKARQGRPARRLSLPPRACEAHRGGAPAAAAARAAAGSAQRHANVIAAADRNAPAGGQRGRERVADRERAQPDAQHPEARAPSTRARRRQTGPDRRGAGRGEGGGVRKLTRTGRA